MRKTEADRFSMTEPRFNTLLKLIDRYERESRTCARHRAYYGACILLAGALEGSLLAMCHVYPEETEEAISSLPPKQRPNGRPERWTLHQLLTIAKRAGWLPARTKPRARRRIGDWVEFVIELRNLVHPGKHMRDYPRIRLRAANFRDARSVFKVAHDHLYAKIGESLREAIEASEQARKK